jgi:hypothetical protein
MPQLRVLTDRGIEFFTDYITQVKANPFIAPPVDKLGNKTWSEEFTPNIEVTDLTSINTRMQLGKYLVDIFEASNVQRKDILGKRGVWSWLALLWFNYLCPFESDGSRKVLENAKYICSSDYTDYYRHLVAAAYDLYSLYGEKSRLFLSTPLNIHSDFVEQYASRQERITNRALIEVLDRLYWDPEKNRPKRGAQSRNRPGNFRRLQSFISQIDLTYDTHPISADEIMALLPAEYDFWKSS